ncbi:MAG: glycerol-3-phosphate acyltransferase [Dehalococcoidales bacterium]
MTEVLPAILLAIAAFWLGACPFSVWVGRWLLGKDIRDYGDGNPGAANVFRAGDVKSGSIALILDVAKGFPFVFIVHSFFGFTGIVTMAVGLSAILGHAFSPFLRLKGGKAIAVTFGVLLALPQPELLMVFIIFILVGFLCLEPDAWMVMLAPVGTLTYLLISRGSSWESLFMLGVLIILAVKHYDSLKTVPRFRLRLIKWYQSRSREV